MSGAEVDYPSVDAALETAIAHLDATRRVMVAPLVAAVMVEIGGAPEVSEKLEEVRAKVTQLRRDFRTHRESQQEVESETA